MAQAHQSGERDSSNQTEDDRQYAESTDLLNIPIPLIREEVDVRKEPVDNATVRITRVVAEKPAIVDEFLALEQMKWNDFPSAGSLLRLLPYGWRRCDDHPRGGRSSSGHEAVSSERRTASYHKAPAKEYHQEVMPRSEDVIVERFANSKTD